MKIGEESVATHPEYAPVAIWVFAEFRTYQVVSVASAARVNPVRNMFLVAVNLHHATWVVVDLASAGSVKSFEFVTPEAVYGIHADVS